MRDVSFGTATKSLLNNMNQIHADAVYLGMRCTHTSPIAYLVEHTVGEPMLADTPIQPHSAHQHNQRCRRTMCSTASTCMPHTRAASVCRIHAQPCVRECLWLVRARTGFCVLASTAISVVEHANGFKGLRRPQWNLSAEHLACLNYHWMCWAVCTLLECTMTVPKSCVPCEDGQSQTSECVCLRWLHVGAIWRRVVERRPV